MNNSKRGAIELGINAIVAIVIALVIIGLGIAFVMKALNPDVIPPFPKMQCAVTADDPLKFDMDTVTIKSGKNAQFELCAYNKDFSEDQNLAVAILGCKDSQGTDVTTINMVSLPQKLPLGEQKAFGTLINIDKNTAAGQYICSVAVGYEVSGGIDTQQNYLSKQLFINVII